MSNDDDVTVPDLGAADEHTKPRRRDRRSFHRCRFQSEISLWRLSESWRALARIVEIHGAEDTSSYLPIATEKPAIFITTAGV